MSTLGLIKEKIELLTAIDRSRDKEKEVEIISKLALNANPDSSIKVESRFSKVASFINSKNKDLERIFGN